ncbi:hypothetical protein CYY_007587 [Polysphondylium violaceum]|uniref:Uncharacterized protein n=1 Tax=Polysphondylium violaceum TaxID=133409 RepID=A0A8J4UQS9_9MYCE|nr:hypothetical protein CYY_007587 [Polysphondylium violaceum]
MKIYNIIISFIILFNGICNCFEYTDTFQVYYLEAPLMYAKYGDLLSHINAFHSGVGFRSIYNASEQFTVDFTAQPSIISSLFPASIVNESLRTEINWDSYATVSIQTLINDTYWSSQQHIMNCTGEQLAQYLCWSPTFNNTKYNLFDVRDAESNQVYLPSRICNDFAWSSFDALFNLGATVVSNLKPSRDYITLYVTQEPVKIEYEDEATWNEITKFYIDLEKLKEMNESMTSLVKTMDHLFNGTFFLYVDDSYYNLSLAVFKTPISFTYTPTPLPSGTPDKSSVGYNSSCYSPLNPNKPSSISGGWIFIIILSCGVSTYLILGVIVNKFLLKQSGLDLIPNRSFWSGFGVNISAGFYFIKSKITGSSSSQYSYISSSSSDNL